MQDQGDRPARAGRPSLLSSGPQAEPEHQRILSSLDGVTPGAPRQAARPHKRTTYAWAGAGIAAVVVGVLAVAVAGNEDHPQAVAAAPIPPAKAVEVAAPAPAEVIPQAAPAPVAAVQQEAPVDPLAAVKAEPEPAPAPAVERPHAKAAKAHAHERKAERLAAEAKTKHGKKKEAHAPEADSDVMLLAALVSHIQPVNRKSTPAEQLQSCKRYNAAGEEQCRARVCEAAGRKEPACRTAPAKAAAPET